MSLDITVEKETNMQNTITSLSRGIRFDGDEKTTVLVGYFDVILEHHKAVISLIEGNMNGSAFALLRPIVEAFYKTAWVFALATEIQISRIHEGYTPFPEMKKLRKRIDRAYNGGGVFSNAIENNWATLNSYTHTGWQQLSRRFNTTNMTLEPVYTEEEIIEVLRSAGAHLALTAILVFKYLELDEKADVVSRLFVANSNNDLTR